jgi:hypothetical protein
MWIDATKENIEKYIISKENGVYKTSNSIWVFLTYYGNVISNDSFVGELIYKNGKLFAPSRYGQDEPITKFALDEEFYKSCNTEKFKQED